MSMAELATGMSQSFLMISQHYETENVLNKLDLGLRNTQLAYLQETYVCAMGQDWTFFKLSSL